MLPDEQLHLGVVRPFRDSRATGYVLDVHLDLLVVSEDLPEQRIHLPNRMPTRDSPLHLPHMHADQGGNGGILADGDGADAVREGFDLSLDSLVLEQQIADHRHSLHHLRVHRTGAHHPVGHPAIHHARLPCFVTPHHAPRPAVVTIVVATTGGEEGGDTRRAQTEGDGTLQDGPPAEPALERRDKQLGNRFILFHMRASPACPFFTNLYRLVVGSGGDGRSAVTRAVSPGGGLGGPAARHARGRLAGLRDSLDHAGRAPRRGALGDVRLGHHAAAGPALIGHGTRRIWGSSIIRQQPSTLVSGVTVATGLDLQSLAVNSSGFRPWATCKSVSGDPLDNSVAGNCQRPRKRRKQQRQNQSTIVNTADTHPCPCIFYLVAHILLYLPAP